MILKRIGYKKTIILGLLLYVLGALCFYPSATNRVYGGFVGSLFTIACGLAMLENCMYSLVAFVRDLFLIVSLSPIQVPTRTLTLSDRGDGLHCVSISLKASTALARLFHLLLRRMPFLVVTTPRRATLIQSNGPM